MKSSVDRPRLRAVPLQTSTRMTQSRCGNLQPLASLEHFFLAIDGDCQLIFARRTPITFKSVEEIEQAFADVEEALKAVPREKYRLLGDTRHGPTRNDPAYESTILAVRGKLLAGFSKNATLASSSVGKLQLRRYAKVDGRETLITSDESEAFKHLEMPVHTLDDIDKTSALSNK